MKGGSRWRWAVRLSWPMLGGMWGAWVGFGGYLRVAHNADSFGSLLALGYFVFFALIGLVAGMAVGALTGRLAEALLLRVGLGVAAAVGAASLVTALALWQIADFVQARYPGLGAAAGPAQRSAAAPSKRVPPGEGVAPSADKSLPRTPCGIPAPTGSKERANWDLECR